MTWILFENADEATQMFYSVVTFFFVCFLLVANLIFWIRNKFKKN